MERNPVSVAPDEPIASLPGIGSSRKWLSPAGLYLAACVLLFIGVPLSTANANTLTLVSASQVKPELRSREGYLLLSVDIEHANATLNFGRMDWHKPEVPPREVKRVRTQKQYSTSLQSLGKGLYLLALPEGWYQVANVEAPYFNLPYRIVVDTNPAWRFHIKRGSVNYVGHLKVPRERSQNSVGVVIKNRVATQFDAIQTELAHLLAQYPLVHGGTGQDDFLTTLQENTP